MLANREWNIRPVTVYNLILFFLLPWVVFFDTYTFSYYRVHNYYSCYTSLSWHPHLIQAIHCFQMRKTAGSLCAVLSV